MKISDLIATLQRRLTTYGDVEVLTTWEGITQRLTPRHVYYSINPPSKKKEPVLLIDAEEKNNRVYYALDQDEGDDEAPLEEWED